MDPHILIIGEDSSLLQTRALILRRQFGFIETCVPTAAMSRLAQGDIALLIICHSIRAETASAMIEEVRSRFPSIKTLQMVTPLTETDRRLADATVEVRYKPMDWIASARHLLQG